MLDVEYLRENTLEAEQRLLEIRNFKLDVEKFKELDASRKALQVETQSLQQERNNSSKMIGQAKAKGEDIKPLLAQVASLGEQLDAFKEKTKDVLDELNNFLLHLPNLPYKDVPIGKTEDDNVEVSRVGRPKSFDFTPLPHYEVAGNLNMMSFTDSVKVTGSRFVVMRDGVCRLHRALTQFMLDVHTDEHGYQEVYVPFIVNRDSLIGTGQLPKFEEDLFKLEGEQDYFLTSTGEVPITNLVRGEILKGEDLPLKFVSATPCFRSEAGSYGRDTKGMIRQHQFEKVELIWVTKPEDSYQAHESLRLHAETILQKLELPYRVVNLCGGDLGFTATKTYDLEVWLPSQDCYREISSCSNSEAFQARRMQTRYRNKGDKETTLVHTLNGSGLAVGRTLVAILENYQTKDGRIEIPAVLQPYMNNKTIL